jgi:hypothetical protein
MTVEKSLNCYLHLKLIHMSQVFAPNIDPRTEPCLRNDLKVSP